MNATELLALQLLADNPQGLYGNDFVELSDGRISRATIYTALERLADAGHVAEVLDPPADGVLSRTKHFLTPSGRRAMAEAAAKSAGLDGLAPA